RSVVVLPAADHRAQRVDVAQQHAGVVVGVSPRQRRLPHPWRAVEMDQPRHRVNLAVGFAPNPWAGPRSRATLSGVGERPALFLGLLADQPELIAEVGALRWRASGCVGTPGPWIEATARDAGHDRLPLTLVAMDLDGQAIGAVTLGCSDETVADVC